MKLKILSLGALSAAALAFSLPNASAGCLSDFLHHQHCYQYNAFTPPVCCPSHHHHHHGRQCCAASCSPGPICSNLPSSCYDGGCSSGAMYGDGGVPTMAPGPMLESPMPQGPTPAAPSFTPPAPTPSPVFNQTSLYVPQRGFGLQPAGYTPYYPAYPANYYPVNNYPMVPAGRVPHYWYNGR